MMCVLVKSPAWYQALTCLPDWAVVHLLADDFWGHIMDLQSCDDNLSWAQLVLVSNSLLGRWVHPCQVSCSLLCFPFVARNVTGSDILQISILIWRAVSFFLISFGGTWYYFTIFSFGSGHLLHSRRFFALVCLLTWWRCCQIIFHCHSDNV